MTRGSIAGMVVAATLALLSTAMPAAAFSLTEAGDAGEHLAGAQSVSPGLTGSIWGTLAPCAGCILDADLYRFDVAQPVTLVATATALTEGLDALGLATLLDPLLHLYDASGYGIVANDDISADLFNANSRNSRIATALTPGTYHLGISGAIYAPFDAAGGRLFQNLIGPNVATPLAGAGPLDHFAETYPANSEGNYRIDVAMTPLAVPEPATSVLLGLGIAAVTASAWRRHRRDGRS